MACWNESCPPTQVMIGVQDTGTLMQVYFCTSQWKNMDDAKPRAVPHAATWQFYTHSFITTPTQPGLLYFSWLHYDTRMFAVQRCNRNPRFIFVCQLT